ncbi:hypothetical protein [Aquitalea sp. ASV11]|uniref:hypothetical protein n=1 Tax=Aquitalea sp. ASV11 TaxID=2795103 RepID=UPI0018EDCC76|nr:hypothetical protein [Aquitalea sp. ASV11]
MLCHRFRGVLGLWDPAFIDALAAQEYQVILRDTNVTVQEIAPPWVDTDLIKKGADPRAMPLKPLSPKPCKGWQQKYLKWWSKRFGPFAPIRDRMNMPWLMLSMPIW